MRKVESFLQVTRNRLAGDIRLTLLLANKRYGFLAVWKMDRSGSNKQEVYQSRHH